MAIEWGSVAEWVSGIGALAAVVTALYLAADARRIKLTGYCGIRLVVGTEGPQKELLYLSVTNIGHRVAVINNIGMKVGRIKKRYAIIAVVKDAYSDGIPISLSDGEVAKWGIPLDDNKKWIRDLVGSFVRAKSDAKSLRFIVYTTHGYKKVIKPEAPLVQEIIDILEAKSA